MSDVMVVTSMPVYGRILHGLRDHLSHVGLGDARIVSALPSYAEEKLSAKEIKELAADLYPVVAEAQPKYLITLGAEAWTAVTGKTNVTKYRGKLYENPLVSGGVVFPTISQAMVYRKPSEKTRWYAELSYLARLAAEGSTVPADHTIPDSDYHVVTTTDDLKACRRDLEQAEIVSFDVETVGRGEVDPEARIVSISLALEDSVWGKRVWAIPLYHPESPFEKTWRSVLRALAKWLCRVPVRIAHNAKYDTKWLNHFDVPIVPTDDTIMMLALLDENARKTLKIAAQVWLGADPWGVDTSKLLSMPIEEVLKYNGLDVWHTLRLWHVLREALNADQTRLYREVSMPIVRELVHIERAAIYVDQERLQTNWAEVRKTLADIDAALLTHVPPVEEWPKKPPTKTGLVKPAFAKHNFNASKFSRWLLYDHFGLPVLERTPSGDESMSQHVLKKLAEDHPVPALMVKRTKWNKLDTAFFTPWAEQLQISPRLHTTFKPWGTVTGRLSSGREDDDKITVSRDTSLGVNIQQIPRMAIARGVFGAEPGSLLIVADYSQIELRIAAFMARERKMLELYRTGADIHTTTAQQMVGDREVTKADRTAAKAVNFGYLYGMRWLKFIELAWNNYGLRVTEEEAQAFRVAFFRAYPDLLPWHDRQRKLVNKFKRVRTPMGRIRHLPDIDSPEKKVRLEAERQAINSPVQAFASDITVLSVIGTGARLREAGMQTRCVGTVHDSILFEAPIGEVAYVLPLIKTVMENPPLDRFGVELDVPLVADLELGSHWSATTTITEEMMTDHDKLTSIMETYQR